MSRIGKKKIKIPARVTIELIDHGIKVKGPKGELFRSFPSTVMVGVVDGEINVNVSDPTEKSQHSLWGTFVSHISNMVEGVVNGFKKELEINGVGYRVAMEGKDLKLDVGYSHPVIYKMPSDVVASVEKNKITIEGNDKERVGQITAEIRNVKKPEPYKGKGIKYIDETIRRKAGKTAKSAAA